VIPRVGHPTHRPFAISFDPFENAYRQIRHKLLQGGKNTVKVEACQGRLNVNTQY
jgi:methionine synthase I (cobalamin-dependent)